MLLNGNASFITVKTSMEFLPQSHIRTWNKRRSIAFAHRKREKGRHSRESCRLLPSWKKEMIFPDETTWRNFPVLFEIFNEWVCLTWKIFIDHELCNWKFRFMLSPHYFLALWNMFGMFSAPDVRMLVRTVLNVIYSISFLLSLV